MKNITQKIVEYRFNVLRTNKKIKPTHKCYCVSNLQISLVTCAPIDLRKSIYSYSLLFILAYKLTIQSELWAHMHVMRLMAHDTNLQECNNRIFTTKMEALWDAILIPKKLVIIPVHARGFVINDI